MKTILSECGMDGKPAIHLNVKEIIDWISHTIQHNAPPKTCFEIITDPSVSGSLGDGIKLFKNGIDIGFVLNANQISNLICDEDAQDDDNFKFINGGTDNVSINIFIFDDYTFDSTKSRGLILHYLTVTKYGLAIILSYIIRNN